MSRCCGSCGSTNFTLVDGFFYCAVCSTQSQVLREFDHEDETSVLPSVLTTKIRQKKGIIARREKRKKDSEDTPVEDKCLPAVREEDFPKVLGHAGLRLATFTKLLSRFSVILIRDFGVPECVRFLVLDILQRYLKHNHIAFCDEELDEENAFCLLVKNEHYETEKKAKEAQVKTQKEAQLIRGENVMSLLTGADFNSSLQAEVTDLDTDDLQLVVEQRTKLSATAVSMLLKIPMNIEIIMAILYVACLLSGSSWILLSDITRWFREGRFPLTLYHSTAMLVGGRGLDIGDRKGRSFCPSTPVMPLHEYVRTVLVLSQLTDIPVQPVPCSFERILARMSYNLNLPLEFMRRVQVILGSFPPNVVFDAQFTRRFGTIDANALLQKTNDRFCDNINFAFERDTYSKVEGSARQYSVLPSVDVKAVAVILFTMKLMFSLDDNLEFSMKEKSDMADVSAELFDFGKWIHQLKMRMNVWSGRLLKDVLGKRTNALPQYDSIIDSYRLVIESDSRRGEKVSQIRGGRLVGGRNLYFKGCVPSCFIMEERDYALYSTFEDDFEPKPSESLEKEALLTPLRYRATRNADWYKETFERSSFLETDLQKIDRYNAEVFFKSFKHDSMDYATPQIPKDDNARKNNAMGSSDVMRMKWRLQFPCSDHYKLYPRPVYCPGLVKPNKSGELMYVPMIYTSAVDVIYHCASPYFSETFADLLELLALTIGEDVKIVYTFFLMLEMKCLMFRTMEDLNQTAEKCEEFTTCAQAEFLGDRPRTVELRMRRVTENISQSDFKYIITDIEKFSDCEKERTRVPSKRTRRRSYGHPTPQKRFKRKVRGSRQQNIHKTSLEEAFDVLPNAAEVHDISTGICNEELTHDFGRMVLRSHEISDDEPSRRERPSKRRSESLFSRRNTAKKSSFKKITARFTEYFSFEFEAAFALTIPKYW